MSVPISVRGLHKVYRSGRRAQLALDHLDLEVASGEVFGLIGPNGAGKSTTIKILVGLVRPSAGEAQIFGAPAGTREARARLGYLPEVANYHEFMTALELMHVHAALAGLPARERENRCREALRRVGLEERAGDRLHVFSKGMKQRFGIAQALVGEPPLLILDELTSGLDPVAQIELKAIILDLKSQGKTILFSSHKMTEVESVCDRVGIVHKGRLQVCGTLDEVLEPEPLARVRFRAGPEVAAVLEARVDSCHSLGSGLYQARVSPEAAGPVLQAIYDGQGTVLEFSQQRKSLEEKFYEIARG